MFLPRLKATIGAKIFGAFVVMSLITGLVGLYGIYVLTAAGRLVVETYDGPLMATNYARSASLTFVEMDRDELWRGLAPEAERAKIDTEIDQYSASFSGDLKVAEDRSQADDVHRVIEEIRTLVGQWDWARHQGGARISNSDTGIFSTKILDRFDILTELIADHSFVARRKAVWSISYFQDTSIAALAVALLAASVITFFLRRRIIRPLAAAATVADRIAHGKLQTPIPDGGSDETGVLLASMRIMQTNIRIMMEREAAQRQSAQNRLIDALESAREGMVLVGPDGCVVIANSEFARFFPTMADVVVPGADFAAAFRSVDPQLFGILSAGGEFQLEDGRWLRCSRTRTQDGGFFLFLSDFTEIKEREESFKEAKRQAEAASKAKSSFLANMSHELRTPLNAIIGFSEIMTGELFGPLGDPHYNEYSDDIVRSGRNLLAIIDSMLDLSKSESFRLHLDIGLVDISTILEDCVKSVRPQCESSALELTITWPAENLTMRGDGAKLRQIFLNLLSNAAKFTEPGGRVSLTAKIRPDDLLEVTIADTGIGIAAHDLPVALAPFGQVDSRLARKYEGTGLGLPLSQVLVELRGGRLLIDSVPGKGTTVTVLLPREIRQLTEDPDTALGVAA
jgi:signal transduction histidine kinase/HAMP domain-containing protein